MDIQEEFDMIMNLFIKNKECIIDKRYNTLTIKEQDKTASHVVVWIILTWTWYWRSFVPFKFNSYILFS